MKVETYLFDKSELPEGFLYPQSYLEIVNLDLPEIEPWWWLAPYKDSAIYWMNTLRSQFPSRVLVPFAKDGASDDVACFDGEDISGNPKVFCIHSFCEPGWEMRGDFLCFNEWLKDIKKKSSEFKLDE
ncbi:hypothetical protein ACUHMQ_18775 [Chitinimonas sp. PSY-7]|uniref:hypothetical protein n=1 Tax=Chitinimonas sp. PSY-7 TaxID=3459088 RepID=UPI0040401655